MTKRQEKTDVLSFASRIALLLILLLLNLSVLASDISDNFSNVNSSNLKNSDNSNSLCKSISIYFFYGEGCVHCAAIEPIVKATCEQCDISFKSYEVFHNASNQILLRDFEKRYCISANESSAVPVIFVGNSALIGDESIDKNLKDAIKFAKENDIHAETYKRNCTISTKSPELLTIATVIGVAFIDSINPCAMGVLIIFITFMITSANFSRRRMTIYGTIYIVSVYIAYFLAGIGILKFLNFINNLGFIIFVNALVVAILLIGVLLAFRDTYVSLKKNSEKNGLWLAIPKSTKGTIEKYMKKGTLPATIILGILVAIVELPCTGQVYLGILTVLNTIDFNYGILLLAIYNLIFVLPLIIILSLAFFGKNLSKIEESWLIRYLIGWLMLILAIILIKEIFKFLNFSIVLPITFSYAEFFIFVIISIIVLFITFSFLRPIVKKQINIWYCAYCYACALAWIFLTVIYMLGVDVPKILVATLIGMSLTGIWEEFKKFNFKYFGLFTIFITVFGITLIYALLIDYKFEFLFLVLLLFVMDGIIVLKNFEIKEISEKKEKFEKEKKKDEIKKEETGKEEEKKEEKNLREILDHCCD
ncbi:MAG: hypothetical protein QMD06_00960 [Candidatus Altarchaeum sp.]|nr:hypothetical protein [Candidatus Altarchaeum sp.]